MSKVEMHVQKGEGQALVVFSVSEFVMAVNARRSVATLFETLAANTPDKEWRGADLMAQMDRLYTDSPREAELALAMLKNFASIADQNPTPVRAAAWKMFADGLHRLNDAEIEELTSKLLDGSRA